MEIRNVCDIVIAQELFPLLSMWDLKNLAFTCRHFYYMTSQYLHPKKCKLCKENNHLCFKKRCYICHKFICMENGWYLELTEGTVKRRRIEKRTYACIKCATCKTCGYHIYDDTSRCNNCQTRQCKTCSKHDSIYCGMHGVICATCLVPPCGVNDTNHCTKCHEEKCLPIISQKLHTPICYDNPCSLFSTVTCDKCHNMSCHKHHKMCQHCTQTLCTDCYNPNNSNLHFLKLCHSCNVSRQQTNCFGCQRVILNVRIKCHKCQYITCFNCSRNNMRPCNGCYEPICFSCVSQDCQS